MKGCFMFQWGRSFRRGASFLSGGGGGVPWGASVLMGGFQKKPLDGGGPCPMPIPPAMGNPALNAIWKTPIYKTLWPLLVDGVQLLQGYTETL